MPFIWDWIREKLSGTSKKSTQPESLGGPEMDNQVGEKVVKTSKRDTYQKKQSKP